MNRVAVAGLTAMRLKVLLCIKLFIFGAQEVEASAGSYMALPSAKNPSSNELDGLVPSAIEKDEYETTSEYEARLAQRKESERKTLIVSIPLTFNYLADDQKYEISTCGEYEVSGYENRKGFSGQNAMGATWDWVEITGRRNIVEIENCKNFYVPMSLVDARAIRESVIAIGTVSLSTQKPYTRGNIYQSPEFGKYILDKTLTYVYRGLIEEVYLGRRDNDEILSYLDFREENSELRAARMLLEAEEINWNKSDYRPVVQVSPVYPRRAKSRGITGYCEVVFSVTETGSVRDPLADNCSPMGIFERASEEAALKLRYRPHTENGRPVEVTDVRYKFLFEI